MVYGQESIEIVTPNGYEEWIIGNFAEVERVHSGDFDSFEIWLSRDDGLSWQILDWVYPGASNQWIWESVEGPEADYCRIKIIGDRPSGGCIEAISQDRFCILFVSNSSWLEFQSPHGGETWNYSETPVISWDCSYDLDEFFIRLSRNNGEDWELITPVLQGYQTCWIWDQGVCGPYSDECLIQVDAFGPTGGVASDVSDSVFTIYAAGWSCFMDLNYPNGGEIWEIGNVQTIDFEHNGGFLNIEVWLTRNNGITYELLDIMPGYTSEYVFYEGPPGPPSNECKVKIIGNIGYGQYYAFSEWPFSIVSQDVILSLMRVLINVLRLLLTSV